MSDGVGGLVTSEEGERLLVCRTGCHLLGAEGWVETNQLFDRYMKAMYESDYFIGDKQFSLGNKTKVFCGKLNSIRGIRTPGVNR